MKISKIPNGLYKCLPKCIWWLQYLYLHLSYMSHSTFQDIHLLMSQYFVTNILIGGLNNFQNENVFRNWKERRKVTIWERMEDWHTPMSDRSARVEETPRRHPNILAHFRSECPDGAWCLSKWCLRFTWRAFKCIWEKFRFGDLSLDLLN